VPGFADQAQETVFHTVFLGSKNTVWNTNFSGLRPKTPP
jgi:hypothetical protein